MQVNFQPQIVNNSFHYNNNAAKVEFTGMPEIMENAAKSANKSKLFEPLKKGYDGLVNWLLKNYYGKLVNSKTAIKFAEKTSNMGDVTKHMAALGATLISGLYVVRTLNNDNLDPQKRKTLAINDGLTWALSTASSYFLDSKLARWCDNVTDRFAANYLLKNPASKNIELLGDWDPANIRQMVQDSSEIAIKKYKQMKAKLSPEELAKWLEKVNMKEKHFESLVERPISNVEQLNSQLLKNPLLDTFMKGFPVLKTLFVFGMVYRYLVPVLVMKPANWLGNYLHNKKAAEQQQPAFSGAIEQQNQNRVNIVERPTMSDFLSKRA